MADEKTPATLKELKSTFPNSTAEWRESQLEAGNDLSQAAVDYAKHVEDAAAKEREQHAKELEEAKASTPPTTSTGHRPLTVATLQEEGGLETGDPVCDFNQAVAQRLPRGRSATFAERQAAIASVARSNPQLHRDYIAANNRGSVQKRLLDEKYDTASA